MTAPGRIVEVFAPSQSPHLTLTARRLEAAIAGELERAIPDRTAALRFAIHVREQAELEEAFRTFRRTWWSRLGLNRR